MTGPCNLVITRLGTGATPFTLTQVNIEGYTCEPWLADDQSVAQGSKVSISGTCLMSAEDWDDLRTTLGTQATRLLTARMVGATAGNYLINLTSATSAIGGPWLKLTATQVIGTALAVVRFDLNDTTTVCDTPVIGHVWTQRMTVDATGRLVRTINGTVRCARNASSTGVLPAGYGSNDWDTVLPYADLFRRAILPPVPAHGWRRESQEFAYDSMGTGLIYSVTDKQYVYDLPDGVRVGDMEFTYERTVQDSGVGTCRVVVELEGDLSLATIPNNLPSGNRRLVETAVTLSKARIDATYPFCIITRMSITERNILSGFSIRFELESQVFPARVGNAAGGTTLSPIARMVGQRFQITRTVDTRTMDAYGSAIPYVPSTCAADASNFSQFSMVPHYIQNAVSGMTCDGGEDVPMPTADVVTFEGNPDTGTVTIAICTLDDAGMDEVNASFEGGLHTTEMDQGENAGGGTQIVSHSISTTNARYDSGLVRMSSMYISGTDLVLQTRRPIVLVTERVEVARANTAPDKLMRPFPAGAMLVRDEWNVSFGKFDQQGTRMFVGVYDRTFSMYDDGGGTGGYSTVASDYAGNIRQWTAPNGSLQPSISPIATTGSQDLAHSVFATNTVAVNNYGVPTQEFLS